MSVFIIRVISRSEKKRPTPWRTLNEGHANSVRRSPNYTTGALKIIGQNFALKTVRYSDGAGDDEASAFVGEIANRTVDHRKVIVENDFPRLKRAWSALFSALFHGLSPKRLG